MTILGKSDKGPRMHKSGLKGNPVRVEPNKINFSRQALTSRTKPCIKLTSPRTELRAYRLDVDTLLGWPSGRSKEGLDGSSMHFTYMHGPGWERGIQQASSRPDY
jgi:hypothetical protein